MHKALTYSELLHLILSEVSNMYPVTLSTLHAVACTCHTFLEPALDFLWYEQIGLGHLVQCLPEDLWIMEGNDMDRLNLRAPVRPTTHQDWERFDYYARRVRCFRGSPSFALSPSRGFRSNVSRVLAPRLFSWLVTSRPTGLLLPNITTFDWVENIPEPYYHSASLLFGRRLTNIRIGDDNDQQQNEAVTSMLRSMPECSPNVQKLTVITHQRATEGTTEIGVNAFQSALGHVFASLTGLRSVTLNVDHSMAPENVIKLSSLPCLRSLMVVMSGGALFCATSPMPIAEPGGTQDRTFRALDHLSTTGECLDNSAQLLSAFQFPSLEEVNLSCPRCSNCVVLERVLESFSVSCSSEILESVYIDTGEGEPTLERQEGADCVTMATLRHLCMFHKLKCVDILTEMSIVLDDGALRDLVMSWPRLETLKLISDSNAGDPLRQQTRVTLRGLVHIVQYCPSLGSLGIDVNTSEPDILIGPATSLVESKPDAQYRNSRIQRVSFSRSLLLGDPAMIGAFLLAIFPNLTHIALGWSEYDELEEWEPVCDAMQALRMESQKEDELSTTPMKA